MTGPATLRAIVLGPGGDADEQTKRLTFYAAVLGLRPEGGPGPGVGPDLDWAGSEAGAEALALAGLVMESYGQLSVVEMRRRLGSLKVAAASRVRAARTAGRGLRQGAGDVALAGRRQSHAGFFGLETLDLSHRRFDGTSSPRITREVFVSGDAVTVLPYDPVRDRVLLIEQFRAGPFGRGDPLPWQLEAIAGRIDPGETPEDAARREAVEEAGLVLGRLEPVSEYYPSPGAMTEYIYSFVALCDLPDGVAGVFGAVEEAEDIKGHLVSFEALLAVVAGGEVANAPMILTAFWLQRERARLRQLEA